MIFYSIFIALFSLLKFMNTLPCPPECLCKTNLVDENDVTEIYYTMKCKDFILNRNKLIYDAPKWSIIEDNRLEFDDDDTSNNYILSIDFSNSSALKTLTPKTIQITNFQYTIERLSLTNQRNDFLLNENSFNSSLYQSLKRLNLSSCCQRIPHDCPEMFRPLERLQILDLSGSDMYKTCLNTEGTISSRLRDLILRNNVYDTNTFSHSSHLFYGVRHITRKLDLQNSRFKYGGQLYGNCLFDIFRHVTHLDLSSIRFESTSNDINIHLAHLIKCKNQTISNGQQLLKLYLNDLKLQTLPNWFTYERFPNLNHLDLMKNFLFKIDLSQWTSLRYVSLAYNPIESNSIDWNEDVIYDSINLRCIKKSSQMNLETLFKLTKNIDFSENEHTSPFNITKITFDDDFSTSQFRLHISRINLHYFRIENDDLRYLDISSNKLTELDLTEQRKLNYLDCSNQYLKQLTLNNEITDLRKLICSNNSLQTIDNFTFNDKDNLEYLDLSLNLIKTLDTKIFNFSSSHLIEINLQSNRIEYIPSNLFHSKLISLYSINLSSNKIHTIEHFAFQSPNLQILDLTNNFIKHFYPNSILTVSLRLFYLYNSTNDFIQHCQLAKKLDSISLTYFNWLKQNGTLMIYDRIDFEKCTIEKSYFKLSKSFLKAYAFYALTGCTLLLAIYFGVYFYRKHQLTLFAPFQKYRKLDRKTLIEHAEETDGYQQDEEDIVVDVNVYKPVVSKV